MIPPYDDAAIGAGQGTIGLEIVADLASLDGVLVPVSGGGLISGIATAVKALSPGTRVIGVEPELAGDAAASFGEIPWRKIQKYVDDIITVSEDEIRDGVRRLAADARLVAEPAGAVPFAAYLHHAGELGVSGNVVAVVSGGNLAMDTLARIIAPADRTPGD